MTDLLQTFQDAGHWQEGDTLIPGEVVDKETAHAKGLLHLSAHLMLLDENDRLLARKRKADDIRYPDLWTSSIGTHVLLNHDYLSTLQPLLPMPKDLTYVGEFRVRDEWENEINGLYIMKIQETELPPLFLADKQFFTLGEVTDLIQKHKTTPHLRGGVDLLQQTLLKS